MKISLIACINSVHALGKDGKLMYHVSNDLLNFKRLTNNCVVIMGRKTWESLPVKPLPNRVNIVISSKGEKYEAWENFEEITKMDPVMLVSLDNALEYVSNIVSENEEVFIIGGASIYEEALKKGYVDKMYLTEVLDYTHGDAYFPVLSEEEEKKWKIKFQTDWIVDPKTKLHYKYSFKEYC